MFNAHTSAFEALTVHLDEVLHRLFFGNAVRVDEQTGHGLLSQSRLLNSLAHGQDHEPTTSILKDTRTWLAELRDVCEMNFDQPEEARRRIRYMQVEWKEAMDRGDMSPSLREGLEGRAFRLLNCTDKEWLGWLDDLSFWKAGWKPGLDEENEA